ncbi:hypothetical protein ACOQFO_01725 [Ureibacillus sp. MALMAid1270]|uniref:hypothetical protein n=1 Tax=Ureibacillus sp. MALMAid1270 TaxID=3411629 RepID=UPI003BA44B5A
MGFFRGKNGVNVTDSEFTWKTNFLKINGRFLETGGLIGTIRVPIDAIETIVIETLEPMDSLNILKAAKEAMSPRVILIGKGTRLAYLKIGIDIANDVQEWLLGVVDNNK